MCVKELDVVLVDDTPDVRQPVCQAVHCLSEKFAPMRTVLDEGAFGISVQFIEQCVDLKFLGSEIEGRYLGVASLKNASRAEHLTRSTLFDRIQERYKLFLDECMLRVGRKRVVYGGESNGWLKPPSRHNHVCTHFELGMFPIMTKKG